MNKNKNTKKSWTESNKSFTISHFLNLIVLYINAYQLDLEKSDEFDWLSNKKINIQFPGPMFIVFSEEKTKWYLSHVKEGFLT